MTGWALAIFTTILLIWGGVFLCAGMLALGIKEGWGIAVFVFIPAASFYGILVTIFVDETRRWR